ncbi:MAG: hypothetical protein ACTHU0_09840, partial [Kofleriaceae bacterium]
MAERRPFPPSARRRSLARRAGLHAASPLLVGAIACAVAALALPPLGRAAGARLGAWLSAACRGEVPAELAQDAPTAALVAPHATAGIAQAEHATTTPTDPTGPTAAPTHAEHATAAPTGPTRPTAPTTAPTHAEHATAAPTGPTRPTGPTATPTVAPPAPAAPTPVPTTALAHIEHATAAHTDPTAPTAAVASLPGAMLDLAGPLLAALALAAALAHALQTRAAWLPRRAVPGAPALDRGPSARVRRAGFELAAAALLGAVALGWLWLVAPRLAALPTAPLAGAALIASALATFAIAWVGIGALDAVLRHLELARAHQKTTQEKRDDERLAAPDPLWRRQRARLS